MSNGTSAQLQRVRRLRIKFSQIVLLGFRRSVQDDFSIEIQQFLSEFVCNRHTTPLDRPAPHCQLYEVNCLLERG